MGKVIEKSFLPHYPALDGLRGVAALMIVWHHFVQFTPVHEAVLALMSRVLGFMWTGVDLFFVLSGFLITNILANSKSGKHYFRAFYGRRILRIFPLYYAVLVIVLLILPMFGVGTHVDPSSQIYFWTYTSNYYFALSGFSANYLSHLWTLAIEEQFYLVWPIIIFFTANLERLRSRLLIAFVLESVLRCILYFLGYNFNFLYLNTLTHSDALILGCYLALSIRSKESGALKWLRPTRAVFFIVAIITFILANLGGLIPTLDALPIVDFCRSTIMFGLLAVIFTWLIYAAARQSSGWIYQLFSHSLLRWFGKYSYALYILHVPLAFVVLRPNIRCIATQPVLAEFELFIIYFGTCILFAYLSWHLFEKHFLKLKRYFRNEREEALMP